MQGTRPRSWLPPLDGSLNDLATPGTSDTMSSVTSTGCWQLARHEVGGRVTCAGPTGLLWSYGWAGTLWPEEETRLGDAGPTPAGGGPGALTSERPEREPMALLWRLEGLQQLECSLKAGPVPQAWGCSGGDGRRGPGPGMLRGWGPGCSHASPQGAPLGAGLHLLWISMTFSMERTAFALGLCCRTFSGRGSSWKKCKRMVNVKGVCVIPTHAKTGRLLEGVTQTSRTWPGHRRTRRARTDVGLCALGRGRQAPSHQPRGPRWGLLGGAGARSGPLFTPRRRVNAAAMTFWNSWSITFWSCR